MIVKKFANVELRCTYSPIGANIARLHYYYDVSFDRTCMLTSRLSVRSTLYIVIVNNMQHSMY